MDGGISFFELQLAEACAAEDERRAQKLHSAEPFAEKQGGNHKRRQGLNVADKRRGLRGELLQRGKVHVIRKTGVHKADDENIDDIVRARDNRQPCAVYEQVKYHHDKGYEQLVG